MKLCSSDNHYTKAPSVCGLVTTFALTAVENKASSIINVVNKTYCNTNFSELEKKITEHKHKKYVITAEFNKLTARRFAAKLAQATLLTKIDFDATL